MMNNEHDYLHCIMCDEPKPLGEFSSDDDSYCSLCMSLAITEQRNELNAHKIKKITGLSPKQLKRINKELLQYPCLDCGEVIMAEYLLLPRIPFIQCFCTGCYDRPYALIDDKKRVVQMYMSWFWPIPARNDDATWNIPF